MVTRVIKSDGSKSYTLSADLEAKLAEIAKTDEVVGTDAAVQIRNGFISTFEAADAGDQKAQEKMGELAFITTMMASIAPKVRAEKLARG